MSAYNGPAAQRAWDEFYGRQEPAQGFLERRGLRLTVRGEIVLGALAAIPLIAGFIALMWIIA